VNFVFLVCFTRKREGSKLSTTELLFDRYSMSALHVIEAVKQVIACKIKTYIVKAIHHAD
jgi:hypothetical protein